MILVMSNLKMAQSNSDYALNEVIIIEMKLYISRIIDTISFTLNNTYLFVYWALFILDVFVN